MNDAIRMQLSAYVDGELPGNEAEMLLRRVCQDAELRREVAEYLALSRVLRGEPGLAAADRLHERVAAEIDHRPVAADSIEDNHVAKAVRPLAGIAIAASVALLAIFGLQQIDTNNDSRPDSSDDRVVDMEFVPDIGAATEQHRQFFLNHANATSRLGANGMNSRLVALQFSEEIADDSVLDDARGDAQNKNRLQEQVDGESENSVTRP